ncbi:MAG: hypothetical protein WCO94_09505, partial [Verrucomicrobiota bacterium]
MKTISLIAILAAVFVAHAWDPAPVVVPVQGGGTATTSKFGDGYTSRARAAGRPIRPPSLAAGQSPATA